jgi:TfoX/Sxy family transcriptional regulator of competence genes
MAYDEKLAARIDQAVRGWPGMSTKKMFGSIGWMLNGNICVGIWKDSLIVRCGPDEWPQLLRQPHVAEFDITGRSMKGWLLVRPPAMANESDLSQWIQRSHAFVHTLPVKSSRRKTKVRASQANAKPAPRSKTRSTRGRRAR